MGSDSNLCVCVSVTFCGRCRGTAVWLWCPLAAVPLDRSHTRRHPSPTHHLKCTRTHTCKAQKEQNMYQYAPQTPIISDANSISSTTESSQESRLVHYTDYSGQFLLVPMQILYLHTVFPVMNTNSYKVLKDLQGKLIPSMELQSFFLHFIFSQLQPRLS